MSPVPGQRAAQSPQVAAVASARATGRAITDAGSMARGIGLTMHGRRWLMFVDDTGMEAVRDESTGRVYRFIPTADELAVMEAEG